MTKHTLSAQTRETVGRQVKHLRQSGFIPASIYGKNVTSLNIQVNTKDFAKLRKEVGESALLYLQVAGDSNDHPVLVREVSFHPVSGQILNISFNQVSLKEKVTAPVPVKVVGESPAERDKLGIMVQQLDEVEVEALPTDMPEGFEVDVSELAEVNASLTVGDLKVDSARLTIKTNPETIIVKIDPLAAEEKVEAPAPAEGEAAAAEAPQEGTAAETPTPEDKTPEKKSE